MTDGVDPGFWTGLLSGSGAVAAFVGAAIKFRSSREERFMKRYDARLNDLEIEVRVCREERPYFLLVLAGMKMLVEDAQDKDHKNPVLKQVAAAFSALPSTDNESLTDLMARLNDNPGTRERSPAE